MIASYFIIKDKVEFKELGKDYLEESLRQIKYRNEWIERVKKRKEKADEIASVQTVTGFTETMIVTNTLDKDLLISNTYMELLRDYLDKILLVHNDQLALAQTKWDSGITTVMNQSNYDLIDFYDEVLIELAKFYPKRHFNNETPEEYFNKFISSRFQWHRLILEPKGKEEGGTILSTMTGGNVMNDLKNMIIDIVASLLFSYGIEAEIDINTWREKWLN